MGLPPRSGSLLSSTYRLIRTPYAFYEAQRAHGDFVTVPAPNGTVVMALTPKAAKEVFQADPTALDAFAVQATIPLLGHSLLTSSGERHRRDRKLLTPPFHGERMRAYGEAMHVLALAHTGSWRAGDRVRAHEATTAISLDVILRTVFGVDEGPAFEEGRRVLRDMIAGFSPLVAFTNKLQRGWFPPWRRFLAARAAFAALVDEQIRGRRASNESGADILGLLLDARYDDGSAMTDDQIRDQLLTILIAGHETTAIALAWALYWLVRHPAVVARLREELEGKSDPTKVAYLQAVCDETMRLHPIVPDVVRKLNRPMTLGGFDVPSGHDIGVAICAIHADPNVYPEPQTFDPERFLSKRPSPFEFLPFGGGHRRCLGAAFSDYEMKIVLAAIVSRFELEPDGEDRPTRRNVTMGPAKGVPLRVRSVVA
jgi:cytochrome P450